VAAAIVASDAGQPRKSVGRRGDAAGQLRIAGPLGPKPKKEGGEGEKDFIFSKLIFQNQIQKNFQTI
jgi:hypothetical protein